jgi:hypothetical protein
MANQTIILDGKHYVVLVTRYEPVMQPAKSVAVSLVGKTFQQRFSYTRYQWGFDIKVREENPAGMGEYGTLSDIKAAAAKDYVSFTDHYGAEHQVYVTNPIQEKPWTPEIEGEFGVFTVPVDLLKRET